MFGMKLFIEIETIKNSFIFFQHSLEFIYSILFQIEIQKKIYIKNSEYC